MLRGSYNDNGKKKTFVLHYTNTAGKYIVVEVKYKKYLCSFLEILLSVIRAIQNSLFLESFSHASKSAKVRFFLRDFRECELYFL